MERLDGVWLKQNVSVLQVSKTAKLFGTLRRKIFFCINVITLSLKLFSAGVSPLSTEAFYKVAFVFYLLSGWRLE